MWAALFSWLYYLVFYFPKKIRFLQWITDLVALWPLIYEDMFIFTLLMRYSPVMPGALPEVFGVVVMWLLSFVLFLAIMANSYGKDRVGMEGCAKYVFPFAVFILVILFVKRPGYNNEYCIKGTCAHMIFENQTSHVSYVTSVGSRVAPELKRLIQLHDDMTYEPGFSRPYAKGPSIVQRFDQTDRPDWISEWPVFRWEETNPWDGTTRDMTYYLDSTPSNMDAVAFLINCPNSRECVESVETWETVEHASLPNIEVGMFFRVAPVYAAWNLTFTFKVEDKVDVQDIFIWSNRTKERNEFFNVFPTYVQHTMKMALFADTVLINETKV